MWLQLTALALLVAGVARAGESVGARVDAFDDGWVTVVMPAVSAQVQREKWTLSGQGTVDVLSGATPLLVADQISSATPFDDVRGAGSVEVKLHPTSRWSVEGAWAGSTESDDSSQSASFTFSSDALERRARASVGVAGTVQHSSQAGGGAEQTSLATGISGSWLQIVSRSTVLGGLASLNVDRCGHRGCAVSLYRFVPLSEAGEVLAVVPERHPDQRLRGAVAVRLSHALGESMALHARWRFYADSWSVLGHTWKLAVAWEGLDDRLLLRADSRASVQSAASFYQDRYAVDGGAAYLSADRELSGLRDLSLGLRADWSLFDVGPWLQLKLTTRVAGLWFVYPHGELPDRSGWIAGGGFVAER